MCCGGFILSTTRKAMPSLRGVLLGCATMLALASSAVTWRALDTAAVRAEIAQRKYNQQKL